MLGAGIAGAGIVGIVGATAGCDATVGCGAAVAAVGTTCAGASIGVTVIVGSACTSAAGATTCDGDASALDVEPLPAAMMPPTAMPTSTHAPARNSPIERLAWRGAFIVCDD